MVINLVSIIPTGAKSRFLSCISFEIFRPAFWKKLRQLHHPFQHKKVHSHTPCVFFFPKQTASATCLLVTSVLQVRVSPWMLLTTESFEPEKTVKRESRGHGRPETLSGSTHLADDSSYRIQFKWPAGCGGLTSAYCAAHTNVWHSGMLLQRRDKK